MITTSFTLTEKELYKSLVEISKSKFVVKMLRIIGIFLFSIMILVTTINIINDNFVISSGFIFPLVLNLLMIFVSEITARLQVPSLLKTKNRFTENMLVEVDSKKISINGESFNIQMSLEKLHSIIETKDFFLLKVSDGSANVIPKRALAGGDIMIFRNIVSSVVSLKTKLKK